MPYIDPKSRPNLNFHLDALVHFLRSQPDSVEGELNYCISYLISKSMKPLTGWRYCWLARAHSVFIMAAAEFYRRLVAPYEDLAIQKNGDVYENI